MNILSYLLEASFNLFFCHMDNLLTTSSGADRLLLTLFGESVLAVLGDNVASG